MGAAVNAGQFLSELCQYVRNAIKAQAERENIPYFIAAKNAVIRINGKEAAASDIPKLISVKK